MKLGGTQDGEETKALHPWGVGGERAGLSDQISNVPS